jgi:hypothetical protein
MDKQKTCLERFEKGMCTARDQYMKELTHTAPANTETLYLFSIEDEFDILKNIRDIEEELLMMLHLVGEQSSALGNSSTNIATKVRREATIRSRFRA